MDAYQPIFDAVSLKIRNGDVGSAVTDAVRDAFGQASHYMACVAQDYSYAAMQSIQPSVLFRPKIYIDGDQWCALYGENLQDGVAGFGDSPCHAMMAFDAAWLEKINRSPATPSPSTDPVANAGDEQ